MRQLDMKRRYKGVCRFSQPGPGLIFIHRQSIAFIHAAQFQNQLQNTTELNCDEGM